MKPIKIFTHLCVLTLLLFAAIGCERDTAESFDDAVLEVLDNTDTPVSVLQTLNFNASLTLKITAKNIAKIDVEVPAGWGGEVTLAKRTLKITAPEGGNAQSETSGNVVITATGVNGSTSVVSLPVEAVDAQVKLTFTDDLSQKFGLRYDESRTFAFSTENVSNIDIVAPKGWTLEPNLNEKTLKVTAPTADAEEVELSGDIIISPKSNRGNKGASSTIHVEVSITAPTLELDVASHVFAFGENLIIHATKAVNVANITVKSAPKGWNKTLTVADLSGTITAPATIALNTDANGEFVFTATSPSGETIDAKVEVKLRGIYTPQEFIAFGDAVALAGALSDYTNGGEINLFANIDLSSTGRDLFVGTSDVPFAGTFNGNGNTITLGVIASGAEVGLFHTLGDGAVVKNLKLAGSISSDIYDPTAINKTQIGVIAINNDGAALTDITSSGSFRYTAAYNGGYFGGLVAQSRKSRASYTNCHTTGSIYVNGIRYLGALIGCIEANTECTMTDCSNSGNMTLDYKATSMSNARVGGCIGVGDKARWTFTRISNTGNISYNFGKTANPIYALGGVVATAHGTFINCFNTGNIIDTDGANALKATRRIGGFAGVSCEAGYPIIARGCYNTGKVSGVSNYLGGFIGIVESGTTSAPDEFTDCYNGGNVTSMSTTSYSSMFGGFAAVFYNAVNLTRCSNRGKVMGFTDRSAGGMVGCAADDIVFKECENSGEIYIGAAPSSGSNYPYVGGLCAIRGSAPVTFINCKNTGAITAMVRVASSVNSVYVSESVVSGGADATACDAATKTASAGATVKAILPGNWTTTIPGI